MPSRYGFETAEERKRKYDQEVAERERRDEWALTAGVAQLDPIVRDVLLDYAAAHGQRGARIRFSKERRVHWRVFWEVRSESWDGTQQGSGVQVQLSWDTDTMRLIVLLGRKHYASRGDDLAKQTGLPTKTFPQWRTSNEGYD